MPRILAIDFGLKRTGLAVTDPLQIIATALDTVPSDTVIPFLQQYFKKEEVTEIVLGYPRTLRNEDTDMTEPVRKLSATLQNLFPGKKLILLDERFTSVLAQRTLLASGTKKKDRQVKGNVDKVSATILLQDYMNSKH
ncbi:MAG: Holliday junction resolvase RuvX [Cyclobacteriaceae bacterium]|nr:Holliday junction resolvase RuvX [Cyclobacteriaceae bacterium]